MRSVSRILVGLALLLPCIARTAEPEPPEITLYAAASLRDVLQALTPACERATGTKLVLNLGASNDLEHQIEAANKADLFFSADEGWMDRLEKAGLVAAATRHSVLSNRLVVIGPTDGSMTVSSAADLLNPAIKWLALANPEAVPAGKYAKAWLTKAGVWEKVKDRVLPSVDVRAALAAVESGGAQAGVVYRTDARVSTRVRVLYEVPEQDGPPIFYALAAMKDRPQADAAARVVAFLCGAEAAAAYEKFGFIVTGAALTIRNQDGAESRLSLTDLRALPQLEVATRSEGGSSVVYRGPSLRNLLTSAGAPTGHALRGPAMTLVVLAEARDGYAVAYSLAELDEQFGARLAIVALTGDGKALSAEDGPIRIVLDGETRHARWIRQLTGLRIIAVGRQPTVNGAGIRTGV